MNCMCECLKNSKENCKCEYLQDFKENWILVCECLRVYGWNDLRFYVRFNTITG